MGLFYAWIGKHTAYNIQQHTTLSCKNNYIRIGLNIQHDANHGAVSRYPGVNRVLGMSQNWIGGSALSWVHQHVVQHHLHTNDVNLDPDMAGQLNLQ